MKLIKALLLVMLLGASVGVMADDYAYLTIEQDSGARDYAVTDISRITFDAQDMVLHLSDGAEARLPLSGLQKMFFSSQATGIASLSAPSQMSMRGGQLHVSAQKGAPIAIYDMAGKTVRTLTAQDGETVVSLSGMQKGVYIVKVGSEARKVMNR